MSKSVSRYIVSAVGLILIAAAPLEEPTTTQQRNPEEQQPFPNWPLTPTFQVEPDGPRLNEPCEPGKDNRHSDLCAQWKAADSAEAAAIWTKRQFWLGVAGLVTGIFTLASAGAAALFARQAAEGTSDANRISKSNALIARRPWIQYDVKVIDGLIDDRGFNFTVTAKLINIGQTPAFNVVCDILIESVDFDMSTASSGVVHTSSSKLSDAFFSVKHVDKTGSNILPNGEHPFMHPFTISKHEIKYIEVFGRTLINLRLLFRCLYRFENEIGSTSYEYLLVSQIADDGSYGGPIRKAGGEVDIHTARQGASRIF